MSNLKALILLTSRPESVEIAVEKLGPERIAVIFSQEVLEAVAAKCSELRGQGVEFTYALVEDPMEIRDSFNRFERLLTELEEKGYSREDVLLDATGGTTPMRLGAALAAMQREVGMVHQRVPQRYVDGRWERDESAEVQIAPMENPLEETGLLREGQAVELFNRRNYGAAALVLEDVAGKVSGVARRHYYRGLLYLAEGYAAWDVADYGTALEKLKGSRGELGQDFAVPDLAQRTGVLVDRISLHLPFLGKVRGKLSLENVVDMLENARRRIEDQGRYDDGVARLYRAVEMYHQWRLSERHSIETGSVNWDRVDGKAQEQFLEAVGLEEPPETLPLRYARVLERLLEGEGPAEDAVFRNLLQQRNRSILAHGLEPIDEKTAFRFLEYADGLVDAPEVRSGAEHARLRGL